MTVSESLFDPHDSSALTGASDWISGLIAGSVTTTLCVIAVAALGMLMLTGQIPLRRGAQVVLGCFLLLGSGTLVAAVQGFGADIAGSDSEPVPVVIERAPPPPLPPANYDPYAGASLRRDKK